MPDKNPPEGHSQIAGIEAFIVDVNGIPRGKRLPASAAGKLESEGIRLPRSAFAVDIWGQDVMAAGLVAETGDNDGICKAPGGLMPMPWTSPAAAQALLSMENADGSPFFGDPRHVLQKILTLFRKKGLTPVVAMELEFYLFDAKRGEGGNPQPPLSPRNGQRSTGAQILSLQEMTEFDGVLKDINAACRLQGVPADTVISENGPGQYEINLLHVPDALQAADHAIFLKRIVKGVARQHGIDAGFMAKPYADKSGSGLHVHFSILDKAGKNIFAGRDAKGAPALRHAIGGLLASMPDMTAIFAPHLNSYRRFAAGSHAPTTLTWGYDNRSAALRVPQSERAATRIEHRVSGADANPYLVLAAILAGAYDGILNKKDPGKPAMGNVYASKAKRLPATWGDALSAFEASAFTVKYLGRDYRRLFLECKYQEKAGLESQISNLEYNAYLRDV